MAVKSDTSKQWRFTLPIGENDRLISKRKRSPQSGDVGISVSFRQRIGKPYVAADPEGDLHSNDLQESDSVLSSRNAPGDMRVSSNLQGQLEILKEVSRESRIIGPFTPRPGGEKLHILQVFGKKESGN